MLLNKKYSNESLRERLADAIEATNDVEELRRIQTDLIYNQRIVIKRFNRAMFLFLIIAAAFILIARGNLEEFSFLGNKIENVLMLPPLLLPLAGFYYYRGMQSQVLLQALFIALNTFAEKLQPEFSSRKLIGLLTAPSHILMETLNITGKPSRLKFDKMYGLVVWAVYAIGPLLFCGWAIYFITRFKWSYGNFIAFSIIITLWFMFRGIGFAWRAMSSI